MQYTEREHTKNVLKTRFYFNYFTCYGATNTQVVRNLLQTFYLVYISNDCTCVTCIVLKPFVVLYPVIGCQNPAADHLYFADSRLNDVSESH